MQEPALWKLAPAAVIKPWGLVHDAARDFTGIRVGVGEFWLASAQTGSGNYSNTVVEPTLRKTLAGLLEAASEEGDRSLQDLIGRPVLEHLRENPHRGKTEAWYVRAAEGRCGVAAGPSTPQDAEQLRELITAHGLPPEIPRWPDEARQLMGLIEPLEGGEVFAVPAGTLHTMFAIGTDSRLVIDELQQGYGEVLLPTLSKILMVHDSLLSVQVHPDDRTVADAAEGRLQISQDLQANPTVRVYDFGRRPGEYPELGFRLLDPDTGLRLAQPVEVEVEDGHRFEVVMANTHWLKTRRRLRATCTCGLQPYHDSYRVLHLLDGAMTVSAGGRSVRMQRGDTVFVPACLEGETVVDAEQDCAFFDDCYPTITALTTFLGTRAVDAGRMEAMLKPPRALPTN